MPASAGTLNADGDAGHDGHLDPGLAAGVHLFPAASEHVGVAALEAHDGEPLKGPVDEDPVDLGLRHRVVRRALADVDDLDVGGQPVEQARGAEPVGDDDVRGRQGLEPGDRHQPRVARSAADEHDPTAPLATATQVDRAGLEVLRQRVAHRRDASRVGVADRHDPECEVAVRARRRHPGRAVAAVGGVDAPRAALLAPPRDLRVEHRVGGGRHDEPGLLEVGLDHAAAHHLDVPVAGHPQRVVRRARVDEHDDGAVLDQPPGAARADDTGAHDEDAAAGEVQPDEGRHAGAMRSMVTRPSSTLTAYTAKSGPRPGTGTLSTESRQRPSASENTCL